MKKLSFFVLALVIAPLAQCATFTNSSSADSFVRALAPSSNYGGAGADSISGANATNSLGIANGAFDTFIRFNTFSMVTNFNSLYGSNSWAITNATLQVTEQAAPNNSLFNRGKGAFEIRWIANDSWTEGTGSPAAPATTGIVYTNEPGLLDAATDVSLGTYTNAGTDGVELFSLPLATAFVNDMAAGGEVGVYMTAIDANIGFTFSSRSFNPTVGRPFLIISAVPKPVIAEATVSGSDVTLSCANGVAGSTYRVLVSSDVTVALSQWVAVATNTLAADGAFSLTVSNALANPSAQQFFVLQMQ